MKGRVAVSLHETERYSRIVCYQRTPYAPRASHCESQRSLGGIFDLRLGRVRFVVWAGGRGGGYESRRDVGWGNGSEGRGGGGVVRAEYTVTGMGRYRRVLECRASDRISFSRDQASGSDVSLTPGLVRPMIPRRRWFVSPHGAAETRGLTRRCRPGSLGGSCHQ